MLVNLVFLFALSSGSAFAAVHYEKTYADILPITVSCIVFIQFLFGILGYLEFGFLFSLGICFGLWGFTFIKIFRKRNFNAAVCSFFSREFWIFIVLYVGSNFLLAGMRVHEWDEFSHWATVVKAMVQEGCLAYHPNTHLTFGDYPPAMALFQYFLQKIYVFSGNGDFSEWRLYLAYIVLGFSFLLPIIKNIKAKRFSTIFIITLVFILIPLPFYTNYYHSLYIDAFLGMLLGAGLTQIVLERNKKSICYSAYIYSVCFMLTMAKFSGILFSVMLIVAYVWEFFGIKIKCKDIRRIGFLFFVFAGLPVILWNCCIRYFNTQSTVNEKIYLDTLWKIISGKDITYRKDVFNIFKLALFNDTMADEIPRFTVGNLGISINYFVLLIFFILSFCILSLLIRKKSQEIYRATIITLTAMVTIWLLFYIGLGATYLFRFSKEEAMRLASYSRYMHTVYLPMWLLLLSLSFWFVGEYFSKYSINVICLCMVLLVTPIKDMVEFIFKDQVSESIESRQPYTELVTKIKKFVNSNSQIYFICQNETHYISGAAYWQIGFEVRPIIMQEFSKGWMLASESKNWYISDLNALEWKQLLLAEYDYVAIYEIDDFFIETYSELFAKSSEIANNSVYVVNKETGFLELCK